ncbi:hypothetical protein GCM10028792_31610 [Salinisphaera aquimarina]
MVVTATEATREILAATIAAVDSSIEIVAAADPAGIVNIETHHPVATYCLECDEDASQAHRALGLIREASGHAPILVIDSGAAGLDLESAIAEGAADLVPLARNGLLTTRLRQAISAGRTRLELLEAGQRLNQSQRRLDVLLSQGQDARATLQNARIIDPSAAFARLIGITDVESARGLDMLERVAPHDRGRVAEALDQIAGDSIETSLVIDVIARQNQRQTVRALLTPGVNEAGDAPCIHVVLQTVDNEHLPLADANRHAGLDGRMALHSVLARTTGRAKERVLGLVFIAIDDIAALRDDIGLSESDLLLQEVGLFLLQSMRGEDRIFRFGAGEYVLLVERHSSNELEDSTHQLHTSISNEVFGDGRRSAALTATLTYRVLSGSAEDNGARLHALMETAYELRDNGGNVCRECGDSAGTQSDSADQQQWIERLRQAMTQDRFSLAYQGITSLAGDSQPYFDVLLRYVDDHGSLVRPGEFLPAAEKAGMMPAIDQWVVRRAVEVIWQQRARDAHIALFVKLSAATIAAGEEFLPWIQDVLKARAIECKNIIFSFREDDVRGQTRQARGLATELEGLGFQVALTHYGSSPKAAQILDKMPAQFIKLAPEFARQMLGGQEDERLAHIITSARERQIPLIAEQIEDANSMARLWQAGVNYVQGHFIQEPDTEALSNTQQL